MNKKFLRPFLRELWANWSGLNSLRNIRHFSNWRKSLRSNRTPLDDACPWITFDAIEFLNNYLEPTHRVFEYGGGGSTLFFLDRCQSVVTVEHDITWYNSLKQRVGNNFNSKWGSHLVQSDSGDLHSPPDKSNPDHYSSGGLGCEGINFKQYATSIDRFDPAYFDVILIDGRSRPACIKHALPKLRQSGLLVLDNADRDYYLGEKTQSALKEYTLLLATRGASPYGWQFTQTNIWRKSRTMNVEFK